MYVLNRNGETILKVFLNKYNKDKNYSIEGNLSEFPDYIHFSIKDNMEQLKLKGYISKYNIFLGGEWFIVLTPEALEYFEKKGRRKELFEELADSEKELLKKIIELDNNDGNISEFLKNKINNDNKSIIRGIIGRLQSNGLINVNWADDTVYYATLTQSGRTYFEREEKYKEEKYKEKLNSNIYNINNLTANNSNFVMGNVINSTLNIDHSVEKIQQLIEKNCNDKNEKKELYELLEETKEIVENINESKHIDKRTGFFNKLIKHVNKYKWFYAEIIGFLGQAVLMKLKGNT